MNIRGKQKRERAKAIRWQKVGAVGIEMIGYDSENKILYVKFRSNHKTYQYFDVEEEVYENLMNQEHKTTFVNKEIKGNYEYAYL